MEIMGQAGYWKYVIVAGVMLIFAGTAFTMQSNSLVGPSSSFMYRNPEWTGNGFIIVATGTILVSIGVAIAAKLKKLKNHP